MSLANRVCNSCGGPLAGISLSYQTKCPWCGSSYTDTHATTVKTATNTDRMASELAIARLERPMEQLRANLVANRIAYDELNALTTRRNELVKTKGDIGHIIPIAIVLALSGIFLCSVSSIAGKSPIVFSWGIIFIFVSIYMLAVGFEKKHKLKNEYSNSLDLIDHSISNIPSSLSKLKSDIEKDELRLAQLEKEIEQHHVFVRLDK